MSKRAIILAGGKGTRLRPYTVVFPKPLMPIGDYPILEVVIRQLVRHGFNHITLAVNHQAELIRAFFGDGAKWQVQIDYSQENEPLGTIGPLRLIPDLPQHFLIMNGDVLTDLDYATFHDMHVAQDRLFSISSYQREHKIDYGVLHTNKAGTLTDFREKPSTSYEVSMGIYMANRDILKYVPNTPYGFDNLMLDLLKDKREIRVEQYSGYWLDIGRPDDYMQAIDEFENVRNRFIDE
jgi:NDP-mannose synthase